MLSTAIHRAVVSGLAVTCRAVDWVLYRPAVVGVTRHSPVFWNCHFARLSGWLDAVLGLRVLGRRRAPHGLCEACHRRGAWLELGGPDESDGAAVADFWSTRTVHLCGWCRPDFAVGTAVELEDVREHRWPAKRTNAAMGEGVSALERQIRSRRHRQIPGVTSGSTGMRLKLTCGALLVVGLVASVRFGSETLWHVGFIIALVVFLMWPIRSRQSKP